MYFVLLFFACFPEIQPTEGDRFIDNPQVDNDEDGLTEEQGDCNDRDASILPGAEEICDGLDNDCNGEIDDNPSDIERYYLDYDDDGFGDFAISELVCPANRSFGFVEVQVRGGVELFDCNDDDASIHPDAQEICDEQDNDCDTHVDEEIETAPTWYLDNDNDGYGDIAQTLKACRVEGGPPAGYVENSADCDDTNALAFPNADERCNGIDDNCNGVVDEATATDAPLWYADADADGFGSILNVVPSCTQPIIASSDGSSVTYVVDNTDCNDSDALVSPVGTEACDAIDNDCDGFVDEGSGSEAPEGSFNFYADNDGDGYGVDGQSIVQCDAPTGFVGNADDCDDFSATVNPGATETCNDVDDNCDGTIDESGSIGETVFFLDADGDGYGIASQFQSACTAPIGYASDLGDCDDADAAIYPTAIEICDEIDNNCDALIDDADPTVVYATTDVWYADSDGDGFGIGTDTVQQCETPQGYIDNADDCNDNKAFQYPGAPERCNNQDDDCDGVLDNNPVDETEWFTDADGDGHGSLVDISSISAEYPNGYDLLACPAFDPNTGLPQFQPGYSRFNNDCNDSDSGISPSASELCSPGVDENCDGDNIAGATDFNTYVVDFDLDGYGNSARLSNGTLIYSFQSCVKPLGYIRYQQGDLLDCNDSDIAVHPEGTIEHTHNLPGGGSVTHTLSERINGKVDLCENDWNGDLTPPPNEWDDDGDGYVEGVIDSSFLYNSDGTVNGWESSQTILGGGDCDDSDVSAYPTAVELCNGAVENFRGDGLCDESVPFDEIDDDGDCFVDCIGFDANTWEGGLNVCEYTDDDGLTVQENIVIGGEDCNDSIADLFPRVHPDTQLTTCFADYDGDGYPDRDWAFCNLEMGMSDADFTLRGDGRLGQSVAFAGDVDGDGLDDILVGATYSSASSPTAGAVYLFLGSTLSTNGSFDVNDADFTFYGSVPDRHLGIQVSSAGDIDRDGLDDIMFSSGEMNDYAGTVYLFKGASLHTPGVVDVNDADHIFVGEQGNGAFSGDRLGNAISTAGDVDGDGLDDILLGAARADSDMVDNVGKAYLILGATLALESGNLFDLSTSDVILMGEVSSDAAATSVSSAGDIDGDGLDDLLISGSTYSQQRGRTFLMLSTSLVYDSAMELQHADYIFTGNIYSHSGNKVSDVGDINQGGVPDILIAAKEYDFNGSNRGKVMLVFGENLSTPGTIDLAAATDTVTFLGEYPGDEFGQSLAVGDVDGDGVSDVIIGSSTTAADAGKVYIFLGNNLPTSGTVSASDADFTFIGDADDELATSLASGGDVNGDGLFDIVSGAPFNDDNGSNTGKAVLVMACEQ